MSNGKGSSPRNIFTETYRQNYDDIFRKKELTAEEISARAIKNGWHVWPATKPSTTKSSLDGYKQVFVKKPLDSGNHNDKKKGETTNDKDKTNHGRVREATR